MEARLLRFQGFFFAGTAVNYLGRSTAFVGVLAGWEQAKAGMGNPFFSWVAARY
jgi:hypothetical protein